MTNANCMMDTQDYKHILRVCNTYRLILSPQCYVIRNIACVIFIPPVLVVWQRTSIQTSGFSLGDLVYVKNSQSLKFKIS